MSSELKCSTKSRATRVELRPKRRPSSHSTPPYPNPAHCPWTVKRGRGG
jgi:hypothetical protein